MADASKKYSLNQEDVKAWLNNLVTFLVPVVVIYLGFVLSALQTPGHLFSVKDFVPTQTVVGAMILYVVNGVYDLLRKFQAGAK